MKKKNIEARKIFFLLVLAFFLVFFSLSIYTVLSGIFSFAELEGWDGKKVAESFSKGNGTEENPYVIHDASEYMYFKSLIEGDTYEAYQDKYYILDANIDFNGHEITPIGIVNYEKPEDVIVHGEGTEGEVISEEPKVEETKVEESGENSTEESTEEKEETPVNEEVATEEVEEAKNNDRIFKGVLDGQGYSLMNFKMVEGSKIEEASYFALFSKVSEAEIKQLNVENYKYEIPELDKVVVSLFTGISEKSNLDVIILSDFNIKVKKAESITIGLIAAESDEDTKINRVYINGEIDDINNGVVRYYDKGEATNIISDVKYDGTILSENVKDLYLVKDGVITLKGEEIDSDDLIEILSKEIDSKYFWSFDNGRFKFTTHDLDVVDVPAESQTFAFSIQGAGNISLHATGKEGTNVYINDLTSDYNYYMGRNYTQITNTTGTIPDGTDRGLYSNSNLATVYIRYSSADINDANVAGRISASEDYRNMYYYKRIPVVSGYVEFDLIDNPWAYRPNNRAFNGWTTDDTNAVISLDIDTYVRHVKIPISDVSTPYSITFYSSWTTATVVNSTSDFSDLKSAGMTPLSPSVAEDLTNYYCPGHVNRYNYYPTSNTLYSLTGTKINSGAYCSAYGGCDYINRCSTNEYSSGTTYYNVTPILNSNNVTVSVFTPTITGAISYYQNGGSAAGYFKQVTSGSTNVYSATGSKLSSCSGTCYQLMQAGDTLVNGTTYYYLTTRDTNIFYPSSTSAINTSGITVNKPMTITGLHNGTDNSANRTLNVNNTWSMGADCRIEYLTVYTQSSASTTSSTFSANGSKIAGNFHNLKIGRGLKNETDYWGDEYLTATSFVGGINDDTSSLEKYTLIVESGKYQNGSGVGYSSADYHYVNAYVTLGNDFDRISGNNDEPRVEYCYSGSWASTLFNSTSESNSYDKPAILTTIKSGYYGAGEADYAAGIYVGGRGAGSHYALREAVVEGGVIYNLIGGPLSNASRAGKNDVIINVKGGTMDFIFGGAGASNTVGNRILNVTGGTINYSVLAGSNAFEYSANTNNPYGKIDGDTLTYVGGSAKVGDTTGSEYNISAGNVFGAGNGRNGELDVGSVNNSTVIIGASADISGSVYGGGNFGAVGGNMTGTSTYTPGGDVAPTNGGLFEDETNDNNIRYYGSDPDNYMTIGGTTYRIIGLFNNVVTPDGTKDLVRVIKQTSYNNNTNYAWSDNYVANGQNRNYYNYFVRTNNDKSAMYNLLNTTYYNGLNATARGYIQTATWNYGAIDSPDHNASAFYTAEHGNTAGSSQSTTSSSFNVGLPYASDYGFAAGADCVGTNLSAYQNDCANWMGDRITASAWTLTPSTYYEDIYNGTRRNYMSYHLFFINANNNLNRNGVAYRDGTQYRFRSYTVFPSFYIKDNIKVTGTGTSSDPFVISDDGELLTDVIDDLAHPEVPIGDYVPIEDDGTYTPGTDYQATAHIKILGGTISDSVYGAGNNNGSGNKNGSRVTNTKITIDMEGGTVNKSIYGGSNEKGVVYGDVLININNGTIKESVYGGGKGGGANGTYVSRNVDVNIGSASTTALTITKNVYGGSAFGTVNGIAQNEGANDSHVRVTVNKGTISGNVFGGGEGDSTYTPIEYGNVYVHVNGGSITKVFGGNDSKGSPSGVDIVYLNGGTIGDAFGGGNNTGQTNSDIRLQGSTITGNLYGGSNASGDVSNTYVKITNGSATEVYGGNNLGGEAGNTHVNITGGTISTAVYGGGKQADSTQTDIIIDGCTVPDVYGGGKQAGVDTSTKIKMTNATGGKIFGGSNTSGDVGTSSVTIEGSTVTDVYGGNNSGGTTTTTNVTLTTTNATNVYGGGDQASSTTSNITVNSGTITNLYGGGNKAGVDDTHITVNGGSIPNLFGGSNTLGDIDESNISITAGTIGTLYGGNNLGGTTTDAKIVATGGSASTVYGGGNKAPVGSTDLNLDHMTLGTVFGGGNEAPVNGDVNLVISNSTATGSIYGGGNAAGVMGGVTLDIDSSSVTGNVFGGGNEGIVQDDTDVHITSTSVGTSIFAGGNGSTAVVQGNSSITIDGNTVVGSASTVAPAAGCVFGSGNAAATGTSSTSSTTTVNIVGAEVFGNVYGGAKMSVVYGATEINIGTDAVADSSLTEGKVHIHGSVFGGGESNASGNTNYDYTFISVTEGIDINIDGTGYAGNSHAFAINGSIFGSGNASSSAGEAHAIIKNLGTTAAPNRAISIQRFATMVMDHSVVELLGAKDRTNDLVDFEYSFNQIDKLTIKNGTTLYLQHNANLLKEFYSGVDVNGSLVKAAVTIDDDTKTVTKNVDNRLYMLSGEKLNVAVNQGATAYGKVQGMTFFGMYTSGVADPYHTGMYAETYNYDDDANASLAIIGGSYVIGLKLDNHDITVDGFYTNNLDEQTYSKIITEYINPTAIGTTGYRWVIGFEAIEYEVPLVISKYSSLGTAQLSMIDFARGNTTFTVLGFDSSGLEEDVELVDSNLVPRIASTEEEANSIFGLSMKVETQEWTGFGTTKLLSANGGEYTGGEVYSTDSRQVAPSVMFYAYHAKNFSRTEKLGEGVLTLQASYPKNEIEDEIRFITITIKITTRNQNDGTFYDASITYDKKYEMPAATDVFITNQSQFTAYFSLVEYFENFAAAYGQNNEFYRVVTFSNPLPVNTIITMLDLSANSSRPEYYYYKITPAIYNASVTEWNTYGEVAYRLSNFIKMDSTSTNNTYNDAAANLLYYDTPSNMVDEEFIFIIDMKDTTATGEHLDNHVSFELRNADNWAVINVVSGRDALMNYNTFNSSNVVLSQTFQDVDNYLYYNVADEFNYSTEVLYNQTENRQSIIDTNYEYSSMGLNVTIFDRTGEQVSSSLLLGSSVWIGNNEYFADGGGVFRIKLANKVSNISKLAKLVIGRNLPAGNYTVRYTLFASEDGLHNSTYQNSVSEEFNVTVVSAENYIAVDCADTTKLVYGETGKNHAGTRINSYTVKYLSALTNPNFRVEVYKRSTSNADSTVYSSVPFSDLFTNNYTVASGNEVTLPVSTTNPDPQSFDFELATDLTSGTYRVVFKLYDNNQLIDSDTKNIIVQKKID